MRIASILVAMFLPALASAQDMDSVALLRLCENGTHEYLIFGPEETAVCRDYWARSIDQGRQRADLFRRQALVERERSATEAAQKSGQLSLGPNRRQSITLDQFIEDQLAFGDVVVTNRGPMVFIGRNGEPGSRSDFVTLDDKRSPVRSKARDYAGASRP